MKELIFKLNNIQDKINKIEDNINTIDNNKENVGIYKYWCSGYSSSETYTLLLEIDDELQEVLIEKLKRKKNKLIEERNNIIEKLKIFEIGKVE